MATHMRQTVLFNPGTCVATPGAIRAFEESEETPVTYLDLHVCGNWGTVCEEDWQSNEDALVSGDRLLSVYKLSTGTRIYVITEWDRSVTTILLPEEY